VLEYEALRRSFTPLADNEQWLADNYDHTVHVHGGQAKGLVEAEAVAEEEEHVLRCLGAALIMQWNTLPAKLQRELYDNAGAMGALLDAAFLGIARFLHRHKDGEDKKIICTRISGNAGQQPDVHDDRK
jgi:hypothetical protein